MYKKQMLEAINKSKLAFQHFNIPLIRTRKTEKLIPIIIYAYLPYILNLVVLFQLIDRFIFLL